MQLAGGESLAQSVCEMFETQLVVLGILPPTRIRRVSGLVCRAHVVGISQVDRGYEGPVAGFVIIRFTRPDDVPGLLCIVNIIVAAAPTVA